MNIKLAPGWLYRAAIVALAVWVLHSFVEALLAACVAAIASWPLYKRFASRLAPRVGRSTTSLLFTLLMIVFVLAPLMFAFGALLTETQAMLVDIAAADKAGFAVPGWLPDVPLAGLVAGVAVAARARASRRRHHVDTADRSGGAARLGAVARTVHGATRASSWASPSCCCSFCTRKANALAAQFRRVLRHAGRRARRVLCRPCERKAVRASVNSMLIVGLFDGLAAAAAYAISGVPHAALWPAITVRSQSSPSQATSR